MLQESRYIPWNQEDRENELQIWQQNCLGGEFLVAVSDWEELRPMITRTRGRLSSRVLPCGMGEYCRMRM